MSGRLVLVADDDAAVRHVVCEALRRDGYDVISAGTLKEERRKLAEQRPDLLITDVVMPDGDGLDLVPELLALYPNLPVIVLSAQNTLATAVRATAQGAFEYLPKPFDLLELRRAVREGLARRTEEPATVPVPGELPLLGRSAAMQDVYRTIARIVGTDLSVLITGESGTGKELVARALHDLGARRARPFVALNMAAIPRELIEAELFGHERGAFTGATGQGTGRFEQAAGGTLFLDEIGDMPPEAQTRLLRVLQTGEFLRVGSGRAIKSDVRIVAATNQNLGALIERGQFREDLYYRLNVVPIALPPLRQRGEDIALLAHAFLEQAAADGLPRKRLDAGAAGALAAYAWPGNVRELENLMRRLAAITRDRTITAAHVAEQLRSAELDDRAQPSLEQLVADWLKLHFRGYADGMPPAGLHERVLSEVERALFRAALETVRGNQLRAAALLGINRNTLRKRITELGLPPRPSGERD